ncbi:MAG TPA: tRNA (guanosine(37)-N1)-methyltransferase TrmD [bacterium]|jgi:tRNA (guanine37-N1)-methyltransferase|nr:tRNA (guanosine(37)-N1)-methyltransferase TrmD [bacterium]
MRTPRIDILTLFPDYFQGPFTVSMVKRALAKKAVDIRLHDLRKFTTDKHHTADDVPYGGGAGMVMKPEPLIKALSTLKRGRKKVKTLLMSPQGKRLDHPMVLELSREKNLLLVCGHYEGLDERVMKSIDGEVSLGDFVMTGGEPAAAVIVDSLVRFLPGVVGQRESVEKDSFFNGLLDYPHYTRPRFFKGMPVPEVLLSGNHARIDRWRKKESLKNTLAKRPDLLERLDLSEEDQKLLMEARKELESGE